MVAAAGAKRFLDRIAEQHDGDGGKLADHDQGTLQ